MFDLFSRDGEIVYVDFLETKLPGISECLV